jgi:sulfate adenylyltransferase large subunit
MHEPVLFGGGGMASETDRSLKPESRAQAGSLLHFVISGSVDDGKSSLLGRLLHDSERLFEDELAALAKDSRRYGTRSGEVDFALLVDGLVAEREQGITIDVAYRYFATASRSFIVADTPGHEQYTRNMATGASTADVAVILVDARKGPLPQTRRHLFIVRMLGIRRIAIAVNKMDLVGYARERFDEVAQQCRDMAAALDLLSLDIIPVSATQGDNIVDGSRRMAWYRGQTLLRYLETVAVEDNCAAAPFRFAVQWVSRPHADFRGYAGIIASGTVAPGSTVFCYPSGRAATVGQILLGSEPVLAARAGQSVLLTLNEEIDVARGDVMVTDPAAIRPVRQARVDLFWMADRPLQKGQSFLAKVGTTTAPATVVAINHGIDVLDYRHTAAATIEANGLGAVTIAFDRPIPLVPYRDCRELGGLILIDRISNDTVGLGLIVADAEDLPAGAAAGQPDRAPSRRRTVLDRFAWLWRTPERPGRSLAKAFTWRMTGSADTFILSFLFTGSARISLAISGTEVVTKVLLYYGHERIWARIKFGLRGLSTPRPRAAADLDAAPSDDDPPRA